ncbi:MAG TPA: hypothetical protein VE972_08365 [Conexibacter sp.]|nr:hypothetical protein [Conexibacter sp.]
MGSTSALGVSVGTIGCSLWVAAGGKPQWANVIGVAGGLGAVFGSGVLLWALLSDNLV